MLAARSALNSPGSVTYNLMTPKPLRRQELERVEEDRAKKRKEASPGFEPGVTVLQTVALPLGDEAELNGAD